MNAYPNPQPPNRPPEPNPHANEWKRFFLAIGVTLLGAVVVALTFGSSLGADDEGPTPPEYPGYSLGEQLYLEEVMDLPGVTEDPDAAVDVGYRICAYLDDGYSQSQARAILLDAQDETVSLETRSRVARTVVSSAYTNIC